MITGRLSGAAGVGGPQGAAIIAAVLVVTLVTAVQNFQKEQQFRQLNQINQDVKVTRRDSRPAQGRICVLESSPRGEPACTLGAARCKGRCRE